MAVINSKGIKSADRVKTFGEVYTPDWVVNDMMDMVEENLKLSGTDIEKAKEYINLSVLEPSCGNGQILIRILSRKLERVKELPVEERELWLLKALSKIYGVDIILDNVKESQERMLALVSGEVVNQYTNKNGVDKVPVQIDLGIDISKITIMMKTILDLNIIHGNTLNPYNKLDNEDGKGFCEFEFNDADKTVTIKRETCETPLGTFYDTLYENVSIYVSSKEELEKCKPTNTNEDDGMF